MSTEPPREVLWIGELLNDDGAVTARALVPEDQVQTAKAAHWRVLRYTLADPSISEAIDIGVRLANAQRVDAPRGFQRRRRRWRAA
jgi:hypothetical protein